MTATAQADLWSERARDWADVMEGWNGWGIPAYRHVLERVPVGQDTRLLDVGCGAGRFARMAADRGAEVAGLDATAAFVEIAGERVLGGDFRTGDMEALPWEDASFDVVTGFNSFFIADDMPAALREARRVLRPRGAFAMTVFGRPEHNRGGDIFKSLARFAPPGSGGGGSGPALHAEGVLEEIAAQAGLEPVEAGYVEVVEEYPDLQTVLRGCLAAPPFRRAARSAGEDPVREALSETLAPFELASGRYRLPGELRCLIARAAE